MANPKLYLAGGFHSGWQHTVQQALGSTWDLLDPSKHGLLSPAEYTAWDLQAIQSSDAVLAVLESSNPGGFSLALEVGYAKALGKRIVLVEDMDDVRYKYYSMIREVSDSCFESITDALDFLARVQSDATVIAS